MALYKNVAILQILFINYIKFVPYILARPSAGLNVFESAKSSALLDLLGNLSNDDDDGGENVAKKWICLVPYNLSNVGDFISPGVELLRTLSSFKGSLENSSPYVYAFRWMSH